MRIQAEGLESTPAFKLRCATSSAASPANRGLKPTATFISSFRDEVLWSGPPRFMGRAAHFAAVESGVASRAAGVTATPHLLLALRSSEQRRGEFWETVSHLAIWICGWIGIGLCFL